MTVRRKFQVSQALAHYVGLGQSELFPRLELRRDLGLEALELVWFVTAFEEDQTLSFPFEQLEYVTVVDDLVQLLTEWLDDHDRSEQLAADEELFGVGPGSGSRRVARQASEPTSQAQG